MDQNFLDGDQAVLFEAEGTPFEEDTDIDSATRTIKEIGVPFRAKSYVSIGTPIVSPLRKLLKKRSAPLPEDIQLQMTRYEFYQVQLTCSFDAAPGCRFHDARFALALQTISDNLSAPAQTVLENAIAYDLLPQKVEDEYKVNIKRGITPQFTFSSNPSSPGISLPLYEGTEEYIVYKGHIEAFDLQGSQPAWSFTRTHAHEIGGAYKLFLVIRKPKGTHVKATLSLTAHIQLMRGTAVLNPLLPLVMLFRRSRNSPVIVDTPTVPLC